MTTTPRAIGRLVRVLATSEDLHPLLAAKLIRSPVLLAPHIRAATVRGTHLRAIGKAMADLPAAPLPLSLTEVEQAEAWLGYHQPEAS